MTLVKSDFVYRTHDPLNISSANGASLYSTDGRRYVDLQASSGACSFGYRNDLLATAATRLTTLPSKPQFCESPNRLELAERLQSLIQNSTGKVGRLAFDLGGAQAIEHALKLVSTSKPASNTILVFEGAYHGRSLATAHLSCSPRYQTTGQPGEFNVVRLPVPGLRSQKLGISLSDATKLCQQEIGALFTDERMGLSGSNRPLHSLLFEPILNVAGMIPIDNNFIRFVIRKAKDLGAHIIADEIFTGFHKATTFLACEDYADQIDAIVLSKGLTNGMAPLAAVWVSEQASILEHVRPGIHSCTYINGELAIAIALAVLDLRDQLPPSIFERPNQVLAELFSAIASVEVPHDKFLHHNVGRITVSIPSVFQKISEYLRSGDACGVITATTGLAPNTFIFHPALTISDEEVELAKKSIVAAFSRQ